MRTLLLYLLSLCLQVLWIHPFILKVALQINLNRNYLNLLCIFLLSVNFKNLTDGLHVLIIFFMLAKFQEDQRLIAMSSNK